MRTHGVGGSLARWALPVAILLACLAAMLAAPDDVPEAGALSYRRDAIAAGQWWRLVTAHFVHLSPAHALLDGAGLLFVAWIFGPALGPRRQALAGVAGVAAVDAGLWFFHPEVAWYVGLSGALHAWFVVGAARWAVDDRRDRRVWGTVLLVGLVGKLVLEAGHGAFWLNDPALAVVTAAHRAGAAGGLCVAVGLFVLRRRARAAGGASPRRRARG